MLARLIAGKIPPTISPSPMKCLHCGGPVTDGPASDESVLASLVDGPGLPSLCRDCASLLPDERDRRAEFYCLWCRRPLGDDGRTPRRNAAPLPANSDACVMFRECLECRQNRIDGGGGPLLQPRPPRSPA